MKKEGHIGMSLIFFAPIVYALTLFDMFILAAVGFFAALFLASIPDKDLDWEIFEHRGFTHTIWFAIILGSLFASLVYIIGADNTRIIASFVVGFTAIVSHIAGDVTKDGIKPFSPISNKKYFSGRLSASNNKLNRTTLYIGVALMSVAIFFSLIPVFLETELSQGLRTGALVTLSFPPFVVLWFAWKSGSQEVLEFID